MFGFHTHTHSDETLNTEDFYTEEGASWLKDCIMRCWTIVVVVFAACCATTHAWHAPAPVPTQVRRCDRHDIMLCSSDGGQVEEDEEDEALERFLSEPHPRVALGDLCIRVSDDERRAETLLPETLDAAKRLLAEYGVVCMRGVWRAKDEPQLITELVEAVNSNYEACVAAVKERSGLDAQDSFGYRQIVHRSAGRYDMLLDEGVALEPLPPRLRAAVLGDADGEEDEAPAAPAVRRKHWRRQLLAHLLGDGFDVDFTAALYAKTGCSPQDPHADGRHPLEADRVTASGDAAEDEPELLPVHALQLFLPLCDMTAAAGATEFWPTSHLPQNADFASLLPSLPLEAAPGDAILFDFRVIHRGTANTSGRWRPILYQTCTAEWFEDDFNFPALSLLGDQLDAASSSEAAAWEQVRGAGRTQRSGFVA